MTETEKIAKDACDYLFRVGKHANARVEFDPVRYLRQRIDDAVTAEREACAKIAEKTSAHSAFHFELGTAVAAAIRNRA